MEFTKGQRKHAACLRYRQMLDPQKLATENGVTPMQLIELEKLLRDGNCTRRMATHYATTGFCAGIRHGNLKLMQWLHRHLHFPDMTARIRDNAALRWSVGDGDIESARWLCDEFHMTLDDARSRGLFKIHDIVDERVSERAQDGQKTALGLGIRFERYAAVAWFINRFSIMDDFMSLNPSQEMQASVATELNKLRTNTQLVVAPA